MFPRVHVAARGHVGRDLQAQLPGDARERVGLERVSDVQHLDKVIKALKSVKGVIDVERAGRGTQT